MQEDLTEVPDLRVSIVQRSWCHADHIWFSFINHHPMLFEDLQHAV
jgi:hypothetical protein